MHCKRASCSGPEPEGVHGEQAELLVGAEVPRQEAADVRVPGVPPEVDRHPGLGWPELPQEPTCSPQGGHG